MDDLVLWHKSVIGIAALLLVAAAYSDARRYRIPNAASLALLGLFPAYVLTAPHDVAWLRHIAVFVVVLAGGYLLYMKKLIAAGDVKLLAVVSLWAGPSMIGILIFITLLAGGLLAVITATVVFYRYRHDLKSQKKPVGKVFIPYGVAIAIGGLCVLMVMFQPDLLS